MSAAHTDFRENRSIPPIHLNLPLESDQPSASDFASRLTNGPRLIVASHSALRLIAAPRIRICGCCIATVAAYRESLVKGFRLFTRELRSRRGMGIAR
jgi:hypothetical protein